MLEITEDNQSVVVSLMDMVKDFRELHHGEQLILYYDTTFNMGDFYVSALLYRHSVFEGSLVIPLLMLIHERRTTESHELLFKWFVRLTAVKAISCMVDREKSTTNAVTAVMPTATIVYYWNLIVGDIQVR